MAYIMKIFGVAGNLEVGQTLRLQSRINRIYFDIKNISLEDASHPQRQVILGEISSSDSLDSGVGKLVLDSQFMTTDRVDFPKEGDKPLCELVVTNPSKLPWWFKERR